VSVARGGRLVLDGVSFSIGQGEHAVILGPNGCGKSTLIATITRDLYPLRRPGSEVRVLGNARWNIFDLRPLLGIVSNDLLDACRRDFSVEEVVLSGFFSSIGLWTTHEVTPAMREKAGAVMAMLEIDHLAARSVNELSAGETRRVVMGRALVHDPQALALDEPTASLDLRASHELRLILRKLARSGISILLVTHHLPDIIPEIQRVILVRGGRVLRDGAKREMLASNVLSELFGTPAEVVQRDGFYHMW